MHYRKYILISLFVNDSEEMKLFGLTAYNLGRGEIRMIFNVCKVRAFSSIQGDYKSKFHLLVINNQDNQFFQTDIPYIKIKKPVKQVA